MIMVNTLLYAINAMPPGRLEKQKGKQYLFGISAKRISKRFKGMTTAVYGRRGLPYPIFIAGIKYPSLSAAVDANADGERQAFWQTSLSLALKRSQGGPCKVKRNIVVLESWVLSRIELLRGAV
jgi:hypothetical protein